MVALVFVVWGLRAGEMVLLARRIWVATISVGVVCVSSGFACVGGGVVFI